MFPLYSPNTRLVSVHLHTTYLIVAIQLLQLQTSYPVLAVSKSGREKRDLFSWNIPPSTEKGKCLPQTKFFISLYRTGSKPCHKKQVYYVGRREVRRMEEETKEWTFFLNYSFTALSDLHPPQTALFLIFWQLQGPAQFPRELPQSTCCVLSSLHTLQADGHLQ